MPKRKIVGLSERIGSIPSLISNNLAKTVTQQGIIDAIQKIRIKAQQEALKNYNADDFQPVIVAKPDATYVAPIEKPIKSSTQTHGKYIGNQSKFTNELYDSYYKAVRPGATSDEDADRQARFLTQKAAFETGYGSHIANTHNYGGHRKNGKWLSFNSIDDFTKRDVALLDKKWSGWRNSKSEKDFVKNITTNSGYGHYAPENEYQGYYGLNKRVNNYINMGRRKLSCGGKVNRPKAFLGAVIGAFGNVASGLIQKEQQEELARKQREAEDRKYYSQLAINMSNFLNNRDAQEAYERQFRMAYENGGDIKITDGGYKIPIGKNTFLLRGGKHEDINETGQGGIGMKIGGKVVEGENNEVVQKTPNEVRIFSDSIGIDGYSFAELARMGYNKDKLFNIQQNMNGDYGTDIAKNGVRLSLPVGRTKADIGLRAALRRAYNRVRNSWIGDAWGLANRNVAGNSAGNDIVLENGRVVHIPGTQGGAPNVLPGRAGGFRPTNVKNAVNTTRQLANKVTQSVRRSTPVNTAKAVTRQPRTLNAPKGDIVNSAKQQVKGYNWPKSEPFQQTGYPNTHISVDPNKVNPYTGRIPFYTVGDAFRSYPLTALGAVGTAGGLAIGGNYLLDNMNNETDSVPVNNLTVNTNNKSYQYWKGRDGKTYYGYITPGEKGNTYNIIGTVKDNQNNNNRSYVYGSARGQNSAPYSAIQIGLGSPSLGSYNINIPSIDGVAFDSDFNSNNESTTVNTGKRRLASRGAVPAQTTLTPKTLSTPIGPENYYPDDEILKDAYDGATLFEGAEEGNTSFDVDDTVDTFVPVKERNNYNFDWGNFAGGIINGVGGLVSGLLTNSALDKAYTPKPPVPIMAAKLPTTSPNGEELAEIDRIEDASIKDARENSYSSSGFLSRINRLRSAMNDKRNLSWAGRRKNETEMLIRDALNQQQVDMFNAQRRDGYEQDKAKLEANRSIYKAYNWGNAIDKIIGAYNDYDAQVRQNKADDVTMNWYLATLPDKDRNWFINQMRGGRNRVTFRI